MGLGIIHASVHPWASLDYGPNSFRIQVMKDLAGLQAPRSEEPPGLTSMINLEVASMT